MSSVKDVTTAKPCGTRCHAIHRQTPLPPTGNSLEVASKILLTAALIAAPVTACASESPTDTQPLVTRAAETTTQPPAPDTAPPDTPHADPASYRYESGGVVGYYFTTPSGLWRCGDSGQPHVSQAMNVAGAPLVPDHFNGKSVAPNAILVNATDHARFASSSQALFWRPTGDAPVVALRSDVARRRVLLRRSRIRRLVPIRGLGKRVHLLDARLRVRRCPTGAGADQGARRRAHPRPRLGPEPAGLRRGPADHRV